eukprot:Clim_evm24s150 gene=Clim_evmTU24s150
MSTSTASVATTASAASSLAQGYGPLVQSLRKLKSVKETQVKKRKPILDQIDKALNEVTEDDGTPKTTDSPVDADPYFEPFRLCMKSGVVPMQVAALDGVQKLIAYGHLKGEMMTTVTKEPEKDSGSTEKQEVSVPLIDLIIPTVCECFAGGQTPDDVQLQVIRVLLTAVSSGNCEVHDSSLLSAFRTCYNIYLISKSLVNQTTAKASLTQMLNVIFQRMETKESTTRQSMKPVKNDGEPTEQELDEAVQAVISDAVRAISNPALAEDDGEDQVTEAEETAAEKAKAEDEKQTHVDEEASTSDGAKKPGKYGFCIVCEKPADKWCAQTRQPVCSVECKNAYIASLEDNPEDATVNEAAFSEVLQRDAYLVFRSLCKMSMKSIGSIQQSDRRSQEIRSKTLALELLLSVLQGAGPVFQTHPMFISAVRQYLCLSLTRNGVSSNPGIFELALNIFLALLSSFKHFMKVQIEVFFGDIFLNILETSTSSFQHKWLVLQALKEVCDSPPTIMDIYLNYDCGLNHNNVVERLINDLSKIAQGRHVAELGATQQQEYNMRVKGVECLAAIHRSMAVWAQDLIDELNGTPIPDKPDTVKEGEERTSMELNSGGDVNGAGHVRSKARDSPYGGSTTPVPADDSSSFEFRKKKKEDFAKGLALFEQRPKKGVKYFQENEFVGSEAGEVAVFLHDTEKLDNTAIGEYLGDPDDFCQKVMYGYVDYLDFTEMPLVEALRLFLSGFRLPGEAQKIDRLMEKFAQRYCENNPDNGIFASADTAYVLAFSIIMLTTDLHSAHVKKKMTKEEFIRNNRGINDSKDLPQEYLEGIYDEIAANEIKMKDMKPSVKPTQAELMNESKRRSLYSKEMQYLVENAQNVLKERADANDADSEFQIATQIELVRPLFRAAWTSSLAAFSVAFQNMDDPEVLGMCLEGFKLSVRIAGVFGLDMERDAFVQGLCKFTSLNSDLGELKPKNVECMKALISLGYTDGNFLRKNWYDILKAISELDMAQSVDVGENGHDAKGSRRKSGDVIPGSGERSAPGRGHRYDREKLRHVQETMGEKNAQALLVSVDKVFASTSRLSGEAIVDFVRWLCQVSVEELQASDVPRMYSLAKMVEIAYYNMGRIRLEWSRMWVVMGEHFNRAGVSQLHKVSLFAVDSLRQLAMQFMNKVELPNFRFQKDFLRPFEFIMNHNKKPEIRDMIVRCMAQMVQARAQNIRSGWKNIFFVFSLASEDHKNHIGELAFNTSLHIYKNHFELIADCFMDAVNCLVEYACAPDFGRSDEVFEVLADSAEKIHKREDLFRDFDGAVTVAKTNSGEAAPATGGAANSQEVSSEYDKIWVKGWFPLLFGLYRIISRSTRSDREKALALSFKIMKDYGDNFRQQWWIDLFRVYFRIFDDLKLPEARQEKNEWLRTTCKNALEGMVDLMSAKYDLLAPILLEDLLGRILWCSTQPNQILAQTGVRIMELFLIKTGPSFDRHNHWDMAIDRLCDMFDATVPTALVQFKLDEFTKAESGGSGNELLDWTATTIKCVVQLQIIQLIHASITLDYEEALNPQMRRMSDAAFTNPSTAIEHRLDRGLYAHLNDKNVMRLIEILQKSHKFAKDFNDNQQLRQSLQQAGFMNELPNLLRQETSSLYTELRLLFMIYIDDHRKELWPTVDVTVMDCCQTVLRSFRDAPGPKQRDVWMPCLNLILGSIYSLDDDRFKRHVGVLYEFLCDVMLFDVKPEIRKILRKIFRRVGMTMQLADLSPEKEEDDLT